jgi:uncharacterized protein (TIGR03437 family)
MCLLNSCLLGIFFAAGALPASNQVIAHYVDIGSQGMSKLLAADSVGNLFVVSTVTEPWGSPQIRIVKMDPQGNSLASFDFGGTYDFPADAPAGAAVDPQGNLVIVGTTQSFDFPLVAPLISSARLPAAFITKVDSGLTHILFSTLLGGVTSPGASGDALALDSAGNIYISGSTGSIDFPVTPNAFQTQPPTGLSIHPSYYAFVTKISPNGRQILFSTYFGADQSICLPKQSCSSASAVTDASALSLDPSGAVVIAGNTTATALPVTPGTYAQQCGACQALNPTGFIARFSADGSRLSWSTYFPAPVRATALTTDGSVVLGGVTPDGFPTTSGVVQATYPTPPQLVETFEAGYVAKLDANGAQLLFSTYLGGNVTNSQGATYNFPINGVYSIALDAQGNIWSTGGSIASSLPVPASTPILGDTYTVALSPDGTSLVSSLTAPLGAAGKIVATTPLGTVVTLGSAGSVLIGSTAPGPLLVGIVNSAGFEVSGTVAPTELISLYGFGLGPATPVLGQLVGQVFTTSLGGVQVLFDGVSAPLLYVGPNLINAIVPSDIFMQPVTTLQIVTPTGTIQGPAMLVRQAQPEVFRNSVQDANTVYGAIALNPDGTVNSAANLAPSGSFVTVWATGAPTLGYPDGGIANGPLTVPALPVSVLTNQLGFGYVGLDSLEVQYAGDAPQMVQGVIQVNFRLLPTGGNRSTYQLQVGPAISEPFVIYQEP